MFLLLLRRLGSLVVTLLLASLAIFLVLEVLPGDPAAIMLGTEAREDTLAALRQQMGLERPPHERYFDWLTGLLSGNFGLSMTYRVPVSELVVERLAVTLPLAILAILISTLLAIPLGVIAAANHAALAVRARFVRPVRSTPGTDVGPVPVLLSASPLVCRAVNPGLGLVRLCLVIVCSYLREHRTVERTAQYDLLAVLTVIVLVRLVLV